ncbi:MarR family winged helix-turn-helix transcriptional regulator [Isoptericola jiangsuensis]|uniref:MarR family winged helix-turn-helix transcriptional regulator n=1 Tax=Isoptericola jiangsuensis TaxID=548579 RepID=UPI003AADC720
MTGTGRPQLVAAVLESVVGLSRELASARRSPFGDQQLSSSQLDALFLLAHAPTPLTPGALADRLGVTRGAVTQLVDGLRSLGLVDQVPHPTDARSRLLVLTPDAREKVADFESATVRRLEPRFAALSTDDLDQLARLLGRATGDPTRPEETR